MSLRTPQLQVEIAVANMDWYPWDKPGRPSWNSDFDAMVSYLSATGCRNVEVHPTDRLVNYARGAKPGDQLISQVVGSLHQTFVGHENGLVNRVAKLRGLQNTDRSVEGMRVLQAALPRAVPSVHYPESPEKPLPVDSDSSPDGDSSYPGSFPIVQPCAELYDDYGVRSNRDLISAVHYRGYIGLCPDTVHARRQHKSADMKPPSWEEVWPGQFASGRVYEMHLGADRYDMAGRDADLAQVSEKEYAAFTSRDPSAAKNTEMGDMIVSAIENWVEPSEMAGAIGAPILRQVIEVPPRLSLGAFIYRQAEHAAFVNNLAELVRDAGAEPLLYAG